MSKSSVFLVGPMGAGKTSIGRELARALRYEFYDSDHFVEERCGADVPWIFDVEGESGFRAREEEAIDELTQKPGIVLSTGGGSVIREINRQRLADRGTVLYLRIDLKAQLKRTELSRRRPLLLTPDREAALKKSNTERGPLYQSIAAFTYDTHKAPIKTIVNRIVADLHKQKVVD